VFSQSAGFLFAKRFWLDGNITLGNQKNFVDLNGLYVYNSFDPTIFKTGLSLFWYATNNISLYTNYTFNKKYIVDNDINYFQHSYTGGLIWKL
jgi:hypothetical protein